jgi:hypothetical protein
MSELDVEFFECNIKNPLMKTLQLNKEFNELKININYKYYYIKIIITEHNKYLDFICRHMLQYRFKLLDKYKYIYVINQDNLPLEVYYDAIKNTLKIATYEDTNKIIKFKHN